jgi:hypothetical protein
LERWFAAVSPMWAASTRRQTRSVIDRHVRPDIGGIPLARVTTAMIDDFYANLRRSSTRCVTSSGYVTPTFTCICIWLPVPVLAAVSCLRRAGAASTWRRARFASNVH